MSRVDLFGHDNVKPKIKKKSKKKLKMKKEAYSKVSKSPKNISTNLGGADQGIKVVKGFNKKGGIMPALIAIITKTIFTEKIMKAVMVAIGDYLVKSSKNKLDDKIWAQAKKAILK